MKANLSYSNISTTAPKSERFIAPDQGQLFNEVEVESDQEDADELEEDSTAVTGHTRKKRRKQFEVSPDVERCRHVHALSEQDRLCSCCNEPMAEIGEEQRDKLDIIPPKLMLREDIYKKYACQNKGCDSTPVQAATQPVAISKVKVTAGMLAFIALQKYQYSLPLYRLEGLFSSLGAQVSRRVMSHWMIRLAEALKPIYLTLEEQLLASNYLHMDETSLQVLKEPGRKATTKSYVWIRATGDSRSPPIVLYNYSPTRGAEVAHKLLAGFTGYLQTDDYSGYQSVINVRTDLTHIQCWDHTRRYFFDAYKAIDEKKRDTTTASQVLKLIKKLYKIESRYKDLDDQDRFKARQEQSLPTLEKIRKLCEEKLPGLASSSLTAKAIRYMLDNWDGLLTYTTNPRLNISNSPAEQKVRPFVVGRKNWLFCNTPSGADASAIIYSIIETAKANDLNVYEYLKNALEKLPLLKTADDLSTALPLRDN